MIETGDLVVVTMPDGSVHHRIIVTEVTNGEWYGSFRFSGIRDWTDDSPPGGEQ